MNHVCYMEGGSIVNALTGNIIENPAILVSKKADVLHAWGNEDKVSTKFTRFVTAYQNAGLLNDLNDLMFIQLNNFKITREMACYVIRRAAEFTATGFIRNLCKELEHGDPEAFLRREMERIFIDLSEKEYKR